MAKKSKSNEVTLECTEKVDETGAKIGDGCHNRNYRVNKSRKFNQTGNLKLRLKKYCKHCRAHTVHTETK